MDLLPSNNPLVGELLEVVADVPELPFPAWGEQFLDVYRNTLNIRFSCQQCHISRSTFNRYKMGDPVPGRGTDRDTRKARMRGNQEFNERLEVARQDALDLLRAKAFERATRDGSDAMLRFLLEHYDPDTFGNRSTLDLRGQAQINLDMGGVREQLYRQLTALAAGSEAEGADPDAAE